MCVLMEKVLIYEAPQVEVIEVEIERGFAGSDNSGNTSTEGWGEGNIH